MLYQVPYFLSLLSFSLHHNHPKSFSIRSTNAYSLRSWKESSRRAPRKLPHPQHYARHKTEVLYYRPKKRRQAVFQDFP